MRRNARRARARSSIADLELVGGRAVAVRAGEQLDAPSRIAASASMPGWKRVPRPSAIGLRLAAEHGAALFVHDGAVVEDVVQLVLVLVVSPTCATRISTSYGFISWVNTWPSVWPYALASDAGVHVFARERVALEVGLAHAGDAQHLELVVLADAGERDAVVDLADLVERADGFSATITMPSAALNATRLRPRAMPFRA